MHVFPRSTRHASLPSVFTWKPTPLLRSSSSKDRRLAIIASIFNFRTLVDRLTLSHQTRSTMKLTISATLLALATASYAQGFGGYGGGNPYSNGGDNDNGDGGDNSPFSNGDSGFGFGGFNFSHYQVVVTAHAVLACLAFAFLFPVGGIMIRLASFRGLWIVHGLFQIAAYILYIAAFGLGIYVRSSGTMFE